MSTQTLTGGFRIWRRVDAEAVLRGYADKDGLRLETNIDTGLLFKTIHFAVTGERYLLDKWIAGMHHFEGWCNAGKGPYVPLDYDAEIGNAKEIHDWNVSMRERRDDPADEEDIAAWNRWRTEKHLDEDRRSEEVAEAELHESAMGTD